MATYSTTINSSMIGCGLDKTRTGAHNLEEVLFHHFVFVFCSINILIETSSIRHRFQPCFETFELKNENVTVCFWIAFDRHVHWQCTIFCLFWVGCSPEVLANFEPSTFKSQNAFKFIQSRRKKTRAKETTTARVLQLMW